MDMEQYKRTLKRRIILLDLLALAAVVIGVVDALRVFDTEKDSTVFCFLCGLAIGIALVSLWRMMGYAAAVRDETKLRMAYNRENDERIKSIRAKAGMPMLLVTSVLMLLVGMIAGFFNLTIFYTLTAAAGCQLVLGCIMKFIYMKIM